MTSAIAASRAFADFGAAGAASIAGTAAGCAAGTGAGAGAACCLGRVGSAMPGWRPLLTADEARWIADYLLQKEMP